MNHAKLLIVCCLLFLFSLCLNIWKLNYGLPFSFFANELFLAEPVFTFSSHFFEYIRSGNLVAFNTNNFVYGTFPIYLLTLFKVLGDMFIHVTKLGDSMSQHLVLRLFTAFISSFIPVITFILSFKLFKNFKAAVFAGVLASLNWSLIYYAHFLNQDIFVTLTFLLCILFLTMSLESTKKLSLLILSGIFFGFAVGTKITVVSLVPLFLIYFFKQKQWRFGVIFVGAALFAFCLSNPFSIISLQDFIKRLLIMREREAGIVFTSVDFGLFKYLHALSYLLTPEIFILGLLGFYRIFKTPSDKRMHLLILSSICFTVLFFTSTPRRVDRWVVFLIPYFIIYSSYFVFSLKRPWVNFVILVTLLASVTYSGSLVRQLSLDKPRAKAFKEMKEITATRDVNTLVYTEEGSDLFMQLDGTRVILFEVYASQHAQRSLPVSPKGYDYIVLSSKAMATFKKPYIVKHYPEYAKSWSSFENSVAHSDQFKLFRSYKTTKLNLLNIAEINIYKNTTNSQ